MLTGGCLLVASCTSLMEKLPGRGDELLGCWRSQQMQVSFSDRAPRDQNADCVIDYEPASVHVRCRGASGDVDRPYEYERVAPDRLRLRPIAGTATSAAKPTELGYRIVDGNWLITTLFDPPANAREKPQRITTLSVREAGGGGETCRPRGNTGLRVSRLSVSSLALRLPEGWDPYLVDPAQDRRLGQAVGTSLFVGAFVPSDANPSSSQRALLVLVVDDVRSGPAPVREAEFKEVKRRFAGELGRGRLLCDQADRACAMLNMPEGGLVYTELFNVRGRVAMVSSTTPFDDANSVKAARSAVQVFVEQLRRDNPSR